MFVVLWEFEVKPGNEKRFESVYGPNGDWAELFRRDPNYLNTRLLRDPFRQRTYVTIDFWSARDCYSNFKQLHSAECAKLDQACARLTETERHLGDF
jgi:heme-degrading monooxygenase HmoA